MYIPKQPPFTGTSPLRLLGFAVIPTPRYVDLDVYLITPTCGWKIIPEDAPGEAHANLMHTLIGRQMFYRGDTTDSDDYGTIDWEIKPDHIKTGYSDSRHLQAYQLDIWIDKITIVGNGAAGLFYGIQTLIQMFESGQEPGELPIGTITDWPERELRFAHWDTKHHQDRLETLRRYIDQLARFKINAVSFELEDKFAYPSHPVIGAPGAFTPQELSELVAYALERHIQIVPNVQGPAHLCYVLKHPEFAHLRCDGSNYQICMDDPEARRLLFDMYDDLVRATPGVEYFHVSTDEVYYAGICEKHRQPYNPVNRSLTYVDYVNAAHAHLAKHGRRIIIWGEYPLLPEHVHLLPPDIIDGVVGDEGYLAPQAELGMRSLIYASMQGTEPLLPRYFPHVDKDGRPQQGRLADARRQYATGRATRGNPIGAFAAAWDDSGLHNETFWPGWVVMGQYAWGAAQVSVEQTIADFMDLFYGTSVHGMAGAWRGLQESAEFYERTWQRVISRARGPAYGDWDRKEPTTRYDLVLDPPPLPAADLRDYQPTFRTAHAAQLAQIPNIQRALAHASDALQSALMHASRNRYNIAVLIGIADTLRHHLNLLNGLADAEDELLQASRAAAAGDDAQARQHASHALKNVDDIIAEFEELRHATEHLWEISRLPRNAPVDGRQFLHVMDDVKDHTADRTVNLDYLFGPELSLNLPEWRDKLAQILLTTFTH
jgi:hypothetical protein